MSRQRWAAMGLAMCTVTGTALVASAATTAPATGWAATHTSAITMRTPALGKAPVGQRLTVSVALSLRNQAAMRSLIGAISTPGSSDYQHYLTPAQVLARFGPTAADVTKVEDYLIREGFQGISVEPNRLLIDASATVGQAERAFHTSLSLYSVHGHTVYVNISPAQVPATLAGAVTAVLGLSDLPMSNPLRRVTTPSVPHAGSPDLNGFGPRAVQHAYDADRLPTAGGTAVAVIMSGDPAPIITNLRYAERAWRFPTVPVSTVYGATYALDAVDNPLSGNLEWDLDTQISTMVAGNVKRLYLYDVSTFTDPEVARGINLFVAQDKALNLSVSLGECDYIAFLDGAMITSDESLAEGALQGQSSFASTGDNGYACPEIVSTGAPEGPPGVSWPADGEYTAAVGGTTLLADSQGNVSNELSWIATGGGISPWETAPPWTLHANVAGQSWQETNQGGRGVPDVAALADELTPYLVYSGGSTPGGVGGTSVSSPLVMGLWTRIQNARHDRLGLASADFYRLYNKVNPGTVASVILGVFAPSANPQPVPGFRDITVGSNGLFVALPGYDYTSGIGALDAGQLARSL